MLFQHTVGLCRLSELPRRLGRKLSERAPLQASQHHFQLDPAHKGPVLFSVPLVQLNTVLLPLKIIEGRIRTTDFIALEM